MFHLARNLYRFCKAQTEREVSLVLIGLPNAGKSTIKEVLANNLSPLTVPTIGVTKPVKLKIGKYKVTVYDLGGQVTDLWRNYYHEIHGAIWVVDAADIEQLDASKTALQQDVQHEMLKGKPILVMANKQDLPQALSESDIATKMGFAGVDSNSAFANTDFSIKKCTALPSKRGETADPVLMEGIEWLVTRIGTMYEKLNTRVAKDVEKENEKKAIELKAREERVAILKEERRKAKEAAEKNGGNPIKAKAPKAPVSFPCTVTNDVKTDLFCEDAGNGLFKCKNPAVKKSGLWKWKPVCKECEDFLKSKQGEQVKIIKPTAEQEAANKEAKEKEDKEIAEAEATKKKEENAVTNAENEKGENIDSKIIVDANNKENTSNNTIEKNDNVTQQQVLAEKQ